MKAVCATETRVITYRAIYYRNAADQNVNLQIQPDRCSLQRVDNRVVLFISWHQWLFRVWNHRTSATNLDYRNVFLLRGIRSACQPQHSYALCLNCAWNAMTDTTGAFASRLPTAAARFEPRSGHVGFVVDKVALGGFSPTTSVSPANSHSTDCSTLIIIIIIIISVWYNRAVSGRRTKWTQSHPTPKNLKRKCNFRLRDSLLLGGSLNCLGRILIFRSCCH
jgi:hypothetical protein